ncbi:hypothetical protein I4F81_006584 [Pyropia yezoensis]|uniref:Uncharacterized protein n=1 Tax=Pyropia yezoensis TaxID=2788 RepID=A0ACC3C2M8_PYRYE|nr:hypothetical protein I4F81_006584 [Neopyropia yezoensis]
MLTSAAAPAMGLAPLARAVGLLMHLRSEAAAAALMGGGGPGGGAGGGGPSGGGGSDGDSGDGSGGEDRGRGDDRGGGFGWAKDAAPSGVVELTAEAAFRMVAAHLFGAAASAVAAADGGSGGGIGGDGGGEAAGGADGDDEDEISVVPAAAAVAAGTAAAADDASDLNTVPPELLAAVRRLPQAARGGFLLASDLASSAAGDEAAWLSAGLTTASAPGRPPPPPLRLRPPLALDVAADAVAVDAGLWAAPGPFRDLMASRLCPAVHRGLRGPPTVARSAAEAAAALVRAHSPRLVPDCEVFLVALTRAAAGPPPWAGGGGDPRAAPDGDAAEQRGWSPRPHSSGVVRDTLAAAASAAAAATAVGTTLGAAGGGGPAPATEAAVTILADVMTSLAAVVAAASVSGGTGGVGGGALPSPLDKATASALGALGRDVAAGVLAPPVGERVAAALGSAAAAASRTRSMSLGGGEDGLAGTAAAALGQLAAVAAAGADRVEGHSPAMDAASVVPDKGDITDGGLVTDADPAGFAQSPPPPLAYVRDGAVASLARASLAAVTVASVVAEPASHRLPAMLYGRLLATLKNSGEALGEDAWSAAVATLAPLDCGRGNLCWGGGEAEPPRDVTSVAEAYISLARTVSGGASRSSGGGASLAAGIDNALGGDGSRGLSWPAVGRLLSALVAASDLLLRRGLDNESGSLPPPPPAAAVIAALLAAPRFPPPVSRLYGLSRSAAVLVGALEPAPGVLAARAGGALCALTPAGAAPPPTDVWVAVTSHWAMVATVHADAAVRAVAADAIVRAASAALAREDVLVAGGPDGAGGERGHGGGNSVDGGGSPVLLCQAIVLAPLRACVGSAHADARATAAAAALAVLQIRGGRLRGHAPWGALLAVLLAVSGAATTVSGGTDQEDVGSDLTGGRDRRHATAADGQGVAAGAADSSVVGRPSHDGASGGIGGAADGGGGGGGSGDGGRGKAAADAFTNGFRAVQLVGGDFLPSLPLRSLRSWTHVLAAYAAQRTDVNAALTAVGLLWRTADALAHRIAVQQGVMRRRAARGGGRVGEVIGAAEPAVDGKFSAAVAVSTPSQAADVSGAAAVEAGVALDASHGSPVTTVSVADGSDPADTGNAEPDAAADAVTDADEDTDVDADDADVVAEEEFDTDAEQAAAVSELWQQLFAQLRQTATDGRPEVRHGAVRTLTGALLAHGAQLDAAAWRGCVRRALLPLLTAVMLGDAAPGGGSGAGGSGGGDHDAAGGGSGGKDVATVAASRSSAASSSVGVQLLLHHSRDTPAKQWNETRVLALAGVARVLRRYLRTLIASRAVAGWGRALAAAAAAATATEAEVAAAGVAALLDLLAAAAAAVMSCTHAVADEAGGGSGAADGNAAAPASGWVAGLFGSAAPADAATAAANGDLRGLAAASAAAAPPGGVAAGASGAPLPDAPPSAVEQLAIASGLWHAVWVAIDECVPGASAEEGAGGFGAAAAGWELPPPPPGVCTNGRALETLVRGLTAVRRGHGGAFGPRYAGALVGLLLRLAAAPPPPPPPAGGGAGPHPPHSRAAPFTAAAALAGARAAVGAGGWGVSPVQVAALEAVEDLDFGAADVDGWGALLGRLLGLLEAPADDSAAAAAAASSAAGAPIPPADAAPPSPTPALTVRVLHVVRSLYAGDRLPVAVKTAALPAALRVLCPLAAAAPVPAGSAPAAAASALRTLVVAVRAALGPAAPAECWGALATAATQLLVCRPAARASVAPAGVHAGGGGSVAGVAAVVAPPPLPPAPSPADAALTVRFIEVVRDALAAGGGANDAVRGSLVGVLAAVAGGGDGGGGGTAAGSGAPPPPAECTRTAQAALLRLATPTGAPLPGADAERHEAVAIAAAAALVAVAGRVLARYAASARRSGRCPLPAGRSAEAAALLGALTTLRSSARLAASSSSSPSSSSLSLPPPRLGGPLLLPAVAACATAGTGTVRARAAALLRELAAAAVEGE